MDQRAIQKRRSNRLSRGTGGLFTSILTPSHRVGFPAAGAIAAASDADAIGRDWQAVVGDLMDATVTVAEGRGSSPRAELGDSR